MIDVPKNEMQNFAAGFCVRALWPVVGIRTTTAAARRVCPMAYATGSGQSRRNAGDSSGQ
jgi:hypothetical protein